MQGVGGSTCENGALSVVLASGVWRTSGLEDFVPRANEWVILACVYCCWRRGVSQAT